MFCRMNKITLLFKVDQKINNDNDNNNNNNSKSKLFDKT